MKLLYLATLMLLMFLSGCSKQDQPTVGLYLAIQRGDLDQIERHIQWGADINQMIADGQRPLHVAADRGRYVITRLLIRNGAEIDATNRQGETALFRAVMAGRTQVAELLLKAGASADPNRLLHQAAAIGVEDRDIVTLLVDWGADINQLGEDGDTPLIKAIKGGHRVLSKRLIANGADVNLAGRSGILPLAAARSQGDPDIIRLLEKNGAELRKGS